MLLFNAASFVYSLLQYTLVISLTHEIGFIDMSRSLQQTQLSIESDRKYLQILVILVSVVISVSQILYIILAQKLYLEFGWVVYKKIGADPKLKSKLHLLI